MKGAFLFIFFILISSSHSWLIIRAKGGEDMSKKIVTLLILGLLVLGGTQLAYATEVVVEGTQRSCFLDLLPEDSRAGVENIISDFHAKITALRERLFEAREEGNLAERDAVRSEMWELKEEKRDAILEHIPAELKGQYMERGFQRQQKFRPEERPARHEQKQSMQRQSESL
jgi:hypothetical protein